MSRALSVAAVLTLILTAACSETGSTVTNCQGVADDTPCGTAPKSECDLQDVCKAGQCVAKAKPDGAVCGGKPTGVCQAQSVCQRGSCIAKTLSDGTACGSLTPGPCEAASTCTKGQCVVTPVADGTACGDAQDACHNSSLCVSGVCTAQVKPAGTVCAAASDATCDRNDVCDASGACVAQTAPAGTGCLSCPAGAGNCGSCAAGVCPDACPAGVGTVLATPQQSGTENDGIMFDIVAARAISITALDTVLQGAPGKVEIRIRQGSFRTVTNTPDAWKTLVSTQTLAELAAAPAPTPLVLSTPIPLKAGETLGVYITGLGSQSSPRALLAKDTSYGTLVSNDALSVSVGASVAYPVSANGSVTAFRNWNGRVTYRVADSLTTGTAKTVAKGVEFDLKSLDSVRLRAVRVQLAPGGPYDVSLFTRFGGYAEAAANSSSWRSIATASHVTPEGDGTVTLTLANDGLVIPAGVRAGFAVTSSGGSGLYVTTATAAGQLKGTSANVELYSGVTTSGPFTPTTQAATPTGGVDFAVCPP